jgi:PIN domain nuclease of toxin-antitoxin system
MKALLDTHALLWATTEHEKLSKRASDWISAEDNELFVSAGSAWEIFTKVRKGQLPWAEDLERDFVNVLSAAGYLFLPISVGDALRAGRLIGPHRDPFDRMIAAQAIALDIPVISIDTKLDAFGVRRIW